MSAGSDTEDEYLEELKQQEGLDGLDAPCATAEDIDSLESHSSTDSKLDVNTKLPGKFKSPVTEALKRVFRSRSSSPKIPLNVASIAKETLHREDTQTSEVAKEPHDIGSLLVLNEEYATCSDNEDNDDFECSTNHFVTPSTLEKLSGKSLTHLNSKPPEGLDVKPMVTSRSFSCLHSSVFKSNKSDSNTFCKRKSEDSFKSFRLRVRKRKQDCNKSSGSRDTPKVFVSIDDDYPHTPEEEGNPSSNNFIDENSDEYDEKIIINENDGLDTFEKGCHAAKVLETYVADKEKQEFKSGNCSKSSNSEKQKEKNNESQIPKQHSLESDTAHSNDDNISPANSIDLSINHDKIPADSKLKMLRKFTLSLQHKDKNKSPQEPKIESKDSEEITTKGEDPGAKGLTTKGEDTGAKGLTTKGEDPGAKGLHNENNSSEESIPSIPDKTLRKGKFRELSSFLIREHNTSMVKKLEETCNDEVAGENPLSVGGPGSKNVKTFGEKVAEYLQRGGSRLQEQQRRLKSQIWSSVVTIVLVKGKNLPVLGGQGGVADPYVKFRLGNEKYKSKVELRTVNPKWLEQFDFHLFEDQSQLLEISVWDKDPRSKDDFIGRCTLDLRAYERESTHEVWVDLEGDGDMNIGNNGKLFLLLTISGTTSSASISDLITYKENPHEIRAIKDRYKLIRSFHNLRDVGLLVVKVFKAQGLAAADFGVGKSDPFCVLELVNSRLQTQTEYKTLTPSWNKIFTFDVKDIHSVLEVTVYDEDRDHKVDFLGKMAIPLLRIRNGEKKWYALKDKKLRLRAKGNHPEILLECSVYWNHVRAAIQTIEPKEEKYMQVEPKFKRQIFVRNVNRVKAAIMDIYEAGLYVKSCFEWESPFRSIVAFVLFVIITYYFEAYMLPAFLLLLFFKNYIVISIVGSRYPKDEEAESSANEDEIDEDEKDKEEKKSLKERLQAIQEVIATVQNAIGYIASISESIKNTFNFTVPFLSWLMVIALVLGMAVLYFIPIRFLVLLWGINKFSRKLIRPHSVVNNELADFLSRVPDDEELKDYREIRPTNAQPHEERKRDGKKKKI